MAGTIQYTPGAGSLASYGHRVEVYRYDPTSTDMAVKYQPLPNVVCLKVERRDMDDPGQATFRYIFDTTGYLNRQFGWPEIAEQVWDPRASGPFVVRPDDQVVVYTVSPAGRVTLQFHGFAQVPQINLARGTQDVSFVAHGVGVRCWDMPVRDCWMRGGDFAATTGDKATGLPVRFNPDGKPNATPLGFDGEITIGPGETGNATLGRPSPLFVDPRIVRDPDDRRLWSLAMAVRYLLTLGNLAETWVGMPDMDNLDGLLDSRRPTSDAFIDLEIPASYTANPIIIRDFDATGMEWPAAIAKLIEPHGFRFRFETYADTGLTVPGYYAPPRTRIVFWRDAASPTTAVKSLSLPPYGAAIVPGTTNVLAMHLAQDRAEVANEIVVETAPCEYESSFVLTPAIAPAVADCASPAAIAVFNKSAIEDTPANAEKYRTYIFGEAQDEYWDAAAGAYSVTAPTLQPLFKADDGTNLPFVTRRRPGRNDLLTKDAKGKPRQARLLLSTNYAGPTPGVWDGTGTWFVVEGGWRLLKDRLGIEITAPDPNNWQVGNKAINFGVLAKSSAGVVKGIEAQAKAGETRFKLRLVTVIEGDTTAKAEALKRSASPSKYAVRRYVDARQRYRKQKIQHRAVTNADDSVPRDDTARASRDAEARRMAGEMPVIDGPVTIGRITSAYRIGDRIARVSGMDLSLQTNAGSEAGEGPRYPSVVGVTLDLDGKQHTILHLSDSRGARS